MVPFPAGGQIRVREIDKRKVLARSLKALPDGSGWQLFTPWKPLVWFATIMDRTVRIDQALAKRNYSPVLRERIERLLDGQEDRARLRCCNSGCFVCVQQLLEILAEFEAGEGGAPTPT